MTHGKPCMAFIKAIYMGLKFSLGGGAPASVHGSSKEEEERKRKRRRKGEEKGRKGKEEGRKGEEKGKKKREEERGGREEKERGRGRSVAQGADPNDKELGTALQEVGFLLLGLFYA